jgi:alkylhydroperoxidase/carboxymuconolactone decarboxylase family protein YurZ
MTSQPVSWANLLKDNVPGLYKDTSAVRDQILADGALSTKTKTLMMMLCDALLGHDGGVTNLSKRAQSLGASKEEVAETVGVAFLMGGLPGLVTGANAFRD